MFDSVADVARTAQDWVGDFGVIITNFNPSTLVADPVALADALSQIVGVSMSVGWVTGAYGTDRTITEYATITVPDDWATGITVDINAGGVFMSEYRFAVTDADAINLIKSKVPSAYTVDSITAVLYADCSVYTTYDGQDVLLLRSTSGINVQVSGAAFDENPWFIAGGTLHAMSAFCYKDSNSLGVYSYNTNNIEGVEYIKQNPNPNIVIGTNAISHLFLGDATMKKSPPPA